MAQRLNTTSPDFSDKFAKLLSMKREASVSVSDTTAGIIADVRAKGDEALFDYTRRFDRFELSSENLVISPQEIAKATNECSREQLAALELAANRIEAYHRRQMPKDEIWTDSVGVRLGWRWTPLASVGVYVPGGMASYPSSVLMNAIPAKVAGVDRVAMVVPTPEGKVNPLVLAAAGLAGITEIYRVGGAQAVAALAYGTETIQPVDKITGPGNAYVAAAKRQVFGQVGIDTIAGPSEILVVSDAKSDSGWIAADLLSQAEHDSAAQSILITDDARFADQVDSAIDAQLENHPRALLAATAWRENSAIIVVGNLIEAPALINQIAPEHLELAVDDPDSMLPAIRNAGAIFLGRFTPEAIGDYVAGPDHVLPTSRVSRYGSGLSVLDFVKRTSIIGCSEKSLAAIGHAAIVLAQSEGLYSHAMSVAVRLER